MGQPLLICLMIAVVVAFLDCFLDLVSILSYIYMTQIFYIYFDIHSIIQSEPNKKCYIHALIHMHVNVIAHQQGSELLSENQFVLYFTKIAFQYLSFHALT